MEPNPKRVKAAQAIETALELYDDLLLDQLQEDVIDGIQAKIEALERSFLQQKERIQYLEEVILNYEKKLNDATQILRNI